ncbi:MAG: multiheme c-type cytochrome [Myxococcota bacterium]
MSIKITTSVALALGVLLLAGGAMAQSYVGSDTCKQCHEDKYNDFSASGHPYKLHTAADARSWPIPLPTGYDWDDISYVIGGYGWKVRYMNAEGYIITDSGGAPGNNQYNPATGQWADYHAGEVKPYNCGSCHTTGFSPTGNQGDLPGIEGTWAFEGIQCEACHAQGPHHVTDPSSANIVVDRSSAACNSCHVRGDPDLIPASGGFVRHREQGNELLASPHAALDCVTCHDPHKKANFSIVTQCVDCHIEMSDVKAAFKGLGRKHVAAGLECLDCHMPYTAKSAVAQNPYKGDMRSHQFAITTDRDVEFFNEAGTLANGTLTGEWVCLGCHTNVQEKYEARGRPERAVNWARRGVKRIHRRIRR